MDDCVGVDVGCGTGLITMNVDSVDVGVDINL